MSLSARRAWIEIETPKEQASRRAVALRKESVDRNVRCSLIVDCTAWSLSARRAWIEIGAKADSVSQWTASLSARRAWIEMTVLCLSCVLLLVALRKESVDRNPPIWTLTVHKICRSPQGERG